MAQYVHAIRDFMKYCGREEEAAGLKTPKGEKLLPHPISEGDLDYAMANAEGPIKVWLAFGAYAGLRVSEMAQLHPGTYNESSITVTGKGSKQRRIPMHPAIWNVLRTTSPPPYVRARTKTPHTGSTIGASLSRHFNKYRIDATPHSLRHRFATQILNQTGDVGGLSKLMGHESVETTMRYCAVANNHLARLVESI